jgi:hypothetical protein
MDSPLSATAVMGLPFWLGAACWDRLCFRAKNGDLDLKKTTGFSTLFLAAAVPVARAIYMSLTAADEKVTLSMVQVKNKPQDVVFPCHIGHHPSKPSHLPCGKQEWPRLARVFCALVPQFRCRTTTFVAEARHLKKAIPPALGIQGAGMVHSFSQCCAKWG